MPEAHKHPMPIKFTVEDAAERLEELVDRAVAGEEVWIVAPGGMTFWLKPLVAPDGSPLPQSNTADNPRHGTSPPRNR